MHKAIIFAIFVHYYIKNNFIMKPICCLSFVFLLCVLSCSNEGVPGINDEESIKVKTSNQLGIKSIVLDGDTLSLESFFPKIETVLVESDSFNITGISMASRIIDDNIIPLTFTGAQTFTEPDKSRLYEVMFTKDVCNAIGLNPDYIYMCYLFLAQLRVGYPAGMSPVETTSPQCGYKPGQPVWGGDIRGYQLQLVPGVNSFVLSTYIFRVFYAKEDVTTLEDKWAPCRAAEIIWNVGLK